MTAEERAREGDRVAECRRAIARRNADLRAVLTVLPEPERDPLAQSGPLAGVPYVLKDVWDTAGIRTTGGSWRHRERVPAESVRAHVALREAGAVLLGKSNLCDLAFSAESDNHLFGPVRNPHDPERTAGGSTGGGAAAVAAGLADFDWGTDFGGSIRMPAALCGVVGLRLSASAWRVDHDHFPRLHPHFWSFCGMGPIARDVATARRVVRAVAPKLREPNAAAPAASGAALWEPDAPHRGAWPTFGDDARSLLARAGLPCERAALPEPERVKQLFGAYLASHFDVFSDSGELPFAAGLAAVVAGVASGGRLDKRIHPNTGKLLALLAVGSLVYRSKARAEERRAQLREAMERHWREGRFVVSPMATELAPRHGGAARATRLCTFAQLGNLVDATAIAVPFGRFPGTALPRSIQILGPAGSEEAILAFAERLESAAHS